MRILDLIASIDPVHGGPVHSVLRLADLFRARGHIFDIVTLDSPHAHHLAVHDVPVRALGHIGSPERKDGPLKFRERFGYSKHIVPWLRAHVGHYDAVLVHGLWNYSTVAARRALVDGDTPYFVFTHGMLDPWFKTRYPLKSVFKSLSWKMNEGILLSHASAVFFTTENEKVLAHDAYKPYALKPVVVGYGCSDVCGDAEAQIAAFRGTVPLLKDKKFLLFMSRLHPKKGCNLLIDAFAGIARDHPKLDLVIAGPDQIGLRAGLMQQAQRNGVTDRIHWPGFLDGDRKWGAYQASEAFILPSHSENFGVVVAEALACARPVLITDKVNLWREVHADGAGLVEPDTLEGIGRLLDRFLAMTANARADMGARARECFLGRFRMEAAADNILAHIQRHVRAT